MVGKVGFLHDKFLQMADVFSETDDATAAKYNVAVTKTSGDIEGVNIAELSLIGVDNTIDLPAGYYVKCLKTGPLIDKHDNYKDISAIDIAENYFDFSLGTGRFGIKDTIDVAQFLSTDEYWAQNNHEVISRYSADEADFQVFHSNGIILMRSFAVKNTTLDLYEVYVSVRDEVTRVWGTAVLVDRVKYKFNLPTTYGTIVPKSAFVTIPNLGTLLFYFGLNDNVLLNNESYTEQLVYIAITRDNGLTWSRYNTILIDPYYGGCIPPEDNFLLDKLSCEIKATYFNNKILVGLMLNGTTFTYVYKYQHLPKNMNGVDTDTTVLDTIIETLYSPDNLLKIKKKSVHVYRDVSYTDEVAYDDGNGALVLTGPHSGDLDLTTSYINYDTREIKLVELDPALFGENSGTAPCYVRYELDGLRLRRFLNLNFSTDLGKSWVVIPSEFISQTIEGPMPTESYVFGGEDLSSPYDRYKYAIPSNFALGYDAQSDKFVLALRGSGVYTDYSTPQINALKNISNLFFFYNIDDEMLKWESSKVTGRSFKVLDSFTIDHITEWYRESHGIGKPAGVWSIEDGSLYQTVITPDSPVSGTIEIGGTTLTYLRNPDPTNNRRIGLHIDLNSEDLGTIGIMFGDGYYAIAINFYNELAKIGFKKYTGSWVNAPGTSEQIIQFSKNTWGSIDIVFKAYDTILVFFNSVLIYTCSDNAYRTGAISLFANKNGGARFKNLGFITNTNAVNIIGSEKKFGTAISSVGGIGCSLDISVDQYNQSWLAANVLGIEFESTMFKNYGVSFNKFRLEKDIERVEGKFLAKDKYVVKFGDNDYYLDDIGNYFAVHDYGIYPSSYAGNSDPDRRAILLSHVWHKNNPLFLLKRGSSIEPNKAIVERVGYCNRSINPNFSSVWCAVNAEANPNYSGWDVTGSYTVEDSHILVASSGCSIYQICNFTLDTFNASALKSAPVRFFDIDHRGLMAYAELKSDEDNTDNTHTVLELQLPSIDTVAGNDTYRVRVNFVDGTPNGSITMDWYDASTSTWANFATVTPIGTRDVWIDILVSILPKQADIGSSPKNPRISAYYRYHNSRTCWRTIIEDSIIPQIKSDAGNAYGVVKFGSYNETATPAKTHFKFVGYSDHNFVNIKRNPIRGESLQSGERVYGTRGIIFTLSGGLGIEDDEWFIHDLNYRNYPKGNILERESVVWRSDDDTEDKEIIIDTKQMFEFDTIILTGTNCRYIAVESSDDYEDPPDQQINIDMVEYADMYVSKYLATPHLLRIHASSDDYPQDFLLNKLLFGEDVTHGTYRIISNVQRCIKYTSVFADAIPVTDWTVQVLGTRIAIKLANRIRNRYIKIIFKKAGLTYPTPDGYFTLGQFAAGIFDELQWNPEYPEETSYTHRVKKMKSMGNSTRFKRLGPVTRSKNLQFNAIDNRERGFAAQLIAIFRHAADDRVFYVPNIYEKILSNAGVYGTYTFELMNCFLPDKLRHAIDWGTLSSLTLELQETD